MLTVGRRRYVFAAVVAAVLSARPASANVHVYSSPIEEFSGQDSLYSYSQLPQYEGSDLIQSVVVSFNITLFSSAPSYPLDFNNSAEFEVVGPGIDYTTTFDVPLVRVEHPGLACGVYDAPPDCYVGYYSGEFSGATVFSEPSEFQGVGFVAFGLYMSTYNYGGGFTGTLTETIYTAPVPEFPAWALMVLGFAALGGCARRLVRRPSGA